MSEILRPHVQYLTNVYTAVLQVAGVSQPRFISEQDNVGVTEFSPEMWQDLNRYITQHATRDYLRDCFNVYGSEYDAALTTSRLGMTMIPSEMWTLACVAAGEVGFRQIGLGNRGSNSVDVGRLSTLPKNAVGPALVNLNTRGILDSTWLEVPEGQPKAGSRFFRVAQAKGGHGKEVKVRTPSPEPTRNLPIFGISPA